MKREQRTIVYDLEARVTDWEISPGNTVEAWAYNGEVPGPVLKARQGDTLIVRLKNSLTEPTTIHWHGLRIPAVMDGTEDVQRAIMPGETFEYRFELPDAGTFWYHPHTNETVQMERGMYGALVVESENEPTFDVDRVLVLDDMRLDRDNSFSEPSWFFARWLERHNGREGKVLLTNGRENPTIQMSAGQTERWRIINASSARYARLYLGGHTFHIIGTDGGLVEKPITVTEILMTPGERYEIAVGPFDEHESFAVESLPYNRGLGMSRRRSYARVTVGSIKATATSFPYPLRSIEPFPNTGQVTPKKVVLHGKTSLKTGVDFMINGEMHLHDEPVRVGQLQVWDISNPSKLDHPFHLHGFFFQILEINGTAPSYRAWKDMVNIPVGGTVRIAWMPDNRPGRWMYHCHILEHHAAGMMAHFDVVG
jgi:FtsP/CotA-like multicopper oxidase with cupredoxin domain